MDHGYSITTEDDLTIIRLFRDHTVDEMLALMDEVAETTRTKNRLWDVSGHFALTPDAILQLAARGRSLWQSPSKVAFVAADDVAFGALRVIESRRDQPGYRTNVFRDFDEARRWFDETYDPDVA